MAHEYATSAELKATLDLGSETFADADIALALSAASRAVDRACDRRFWLDADATSVRLYSPENGRRLWIDDLAALTSVQADPDGDQVYEETWVRGQDFILRPSNAPADGWPWTTIEIHPRTSFYLPCSYPESIKVTGQFGWAAVPEPIKMATMVVAGKLIKRVREAPFGVVGLGMDGVAVRIASTDPQVSELTFPYQRHTH